MKVHFIDTLFSILKPIFHCYAKPFALGPGVGLDPQRHNFALVIPTCWYLKTLNFALPPTRTLKFALPLSLKPPTRTGGIYIGRVGSPTQNSGVGHVHVHLIFLVFDFICAGSRFSVEYWRPALGALMKLKR